MAARKMFIVVVVDESGSMLSVRHATISGLNEYVQTQRQKAKEDGVTVLFSLTKFNTKCTPMYVATPIDDIEELTEETYSPNDMTALYDAIGISIKNLEADLVREQSEKPSVLFVVMTDGAENSSKEYGAKQIKALIDQKKADGNWTFVFLGADIDTWVGEQIGFSAANSLRYAKSKSGQVFRAMAASTSNYAKKLSKLADDESLGSVNFMDEAADAWQGLKEPNSKESSNSSDEQKT